MPEKELVVSDREWFPRAARIWVDMERGLYDWGEKKPPRNGDGGRRVVKSRILSDLGITADYHNARERVWENPHFKRALELENRRRDLGIADMVTEMEAVVGPLHETRRKVIERVKAIFEHEPDADDPLALSPKDYSAQGLQWIRYIDETEGRSAAVKEQTLEHIMADMAKTNRVNAEMMGNAMEILKRHRAEQDARLSNMGFIEGELEDE